MYSLCNLGLAKISNLNINGGIADLSELLNLCPSDTNALTGRGLAYYSLGKIKEGQNETEGAMELFNQALVDLNKATKLDPGLIEAMQNRALVNKALGNLTQAEADFVEYMRLKEKLLPEKNS